jgi:hypothetical protein
MLEQCMDMLDHQNDALNTQADEFTFLRTKMRHLEYLMDAFKFSHGSFIVIYLIVADDLHIYI